MCDYEIMGEINKYSIIFLVRMSAIPYTNKIDVHEL